MPRVVKLLGQIPQRDPLLKWEFSTLTSQRCLLWPQPPRKLNWRKENFQPVGGEDGKRIPLPGDKLAAPASCRRLSCCGRSATELARTCGARRSFPSQSRQIWEERTAGLRREGELSVPSPCQQQALYLRSCQNTYFSPKLSHPEKAGSGAKMQTFLKNFLPRPSVWYHLPVYVL